MWMLYSVGVSSRPWRGHCLSWAISSNGFPWRRQGDSALLSSQLKLEDALRMDSPPGAFAARLTNQLIARLRRPNPASCRDSILHGNNYDPVSSRDQGTLWRNGSASDSRSEGCVFESRQGHFFLFLPTFPLFSLLFPYVHSCSSLFFLSVILLTSEIGTVQVAQKKAHTQDE